MYKMNSIEILCNQLSYSKIEYDEFQELKNSLTNEFNVNNTIERYQRYIRCITVWKVDGMCFEYIQQLILEFLNNNNNINLSKIIDIELIKMLN